MAKHNETGALGERIARHWLVKRGHTILETNYHKKWGEIDIVSRETSKLHFVEVKTVSYKTLDQLKMAVSHETWRPEENVHRAKTQRLSRAIQTWLAEHTYKGAFQIDILTVRMVPREKYAKVELIENVIFEQ